MKLDVPGRIAVGPPLQIHIGIDHPQRSGFRGGKRILSAPDETKIICKLRGILITERGILGHHLHDNAREGFRNVGIDFVRRDQSPEQMLLGDFGSG